MSEQDQDFHSLHEHLERIFKDIEDGVFLSADEIGDLRYACGLPARNTQVNPILRDVINSFGDALASFPSIRKSS